MNTYYPIQQGHVWVARVGETDGAGTVGESTPPATTSEAWWKLGNATSGSVTPTIETKTRTKIVMGQRLTEDVPVSEKWSGKITVEELSKAVVDLIFKSATTATNAFISHGSVSRKCWVRIQTYETDDSNRIIFEGLAVVKPSGEVKLFGEDVFSQDFDMDFLGKVSGSLLDAYSV